jgi:hypothetical protein
MGRRSLIQTMFAAGLDITTAREAMRGIKGFMIKARLESRFIKCLPHRQRKSDGIATSLVRTFYKC